MQYFQWEGVRLLTPDGWSEPTSIGVADGYFCAQVPESAPRIDAQGAYLLPGLIDLHGDGFERQMLPRPGVQVPDALALASIETALLGHGITTFCWAITDGFEPGLRSRAGLRSIKGLLAGHADTARLRHVLHVRHERVNTEGHAELLDWIERGEIGMLSLNDHLPDPDDPQRTERFLRGYRQREACSPEVAARLFRQLQTQRALGMQQEVELAAAARRAGLCLASHDDADARMAERSLALGIHLAEFPTCVAVARQLRAGGAACMFGAPNLVRGGSHLGLISAAEAVRSGVCDVLVSDYHWPSLLRAPFLLAEQGLLSLAQAWELVSGNPARILGLGDELGRVAPGYRADALVVRDLKGLSSSIQAVLCGGRLEVLSAALAGRCDRQPSLQR